MSKSNKNRERRETVEQLRKQAKAAERRRSLIIVSICAAIALIIVGVGVVSIVKKNQKEDKLAKTELSDIGTSAEAAGCSAIQEDDATGAGQHVTTHVIYNNNPPSFGQHNPTPAATDVHFYTADDRPDVEVLVHNLEHGWTIVWYDETVADDSDEMDLLKATADKFDAASDDFTSHVIIAPWTKDDGEGTGIPDGKHIAFTHWSVHQPTYDPDFWSSIPQGEQPDSWGESQYCDTFSGDALTEFTTKYPYDDAPEGTLWH